MACGKRKFQPGSLYRMSPRSEQILTQVAGRSHSERVIGGVVVPVPAAEPGHYGAGERGSIRCQT